MEDIPKNLPQPADKTSLSSTVLSSHSPMRKSSSTSPICSCTASSKNDGLPPATDSLPPTSVFSIANSTLDLKSSTIVTEKSELSKLSTTTSDSANSNPINQIPPNSTKAAAMVAQEQENSSLLGVEDISIPKSCIQRLAKSVLPPQTSIQKDALLALSRSATVFVSYLNSHANISAGMASKKTVRSRDVFNALQSIEFGGFVSKLEADLPSLNMVSSKPNRGQPLMTNSDAAPTTMDIVPGEGVASLSGLSTLRAINPPNESGRHARKSSDLVHTSMDDEIIKSPIPSETKGQMGQGKISEKSTSVDATLELAVARKKTVEIKGKASEPVTKKMRGIKREAVKRTGNESVKLAKTTELVMSDGAVPNESYRRKGGSDEEYDDEEDDDDEGEEESVDEENANEEDDGDDNVDDEENAREALKQIEIEIAGDAVEECENVMNVQNKQIDRIIARRGVSVDKTAILDGHKRIKEVVKESYLTDDEVEHDEDEDEND